MIVDETYVMGRLGIDSIQMKCARYSGRIPDRAEWELDDIEVYLKAWERSLRAKKKDIDRDANHSCVSRVVPS
jgi:hypothetical protein